MQTGDEILSQEKKNSNVENSQQETGEGGGIWKIVFYTGGAILLIALIAGGIYYFNKSGKVIPEKKFVEEDLPKLEEPKKDLDVGDDGLKGKVEKAVVSVRKDHRTEEDFSSPLEDTDKTPSVEEVESKKEPVRVPFGEAAEKLDEKKKLDVVELSMKDVAEDTLKDDKLSPPTIEDTENTVEQIIPPSVEEVKKEIKPTFTNEVSPEDSEKDKEIIATLSEENTTPTETKKDEDTLPSTLEPSKEEKDKKTLESTEPTNIPDVVDEKDKPSTTIEENQTIIPETDIDTSLIPDSKTNVVSEPNKEDIINNTDSKEKEIESITSVDVDGKNVESQSEVNVSSNKDNIEGEMMSQGSLLI